LSTGKCSESQLASVLKVKDPNSSVRNFVI
jgi:hypothetical protein